MPGSNATGIEYVCHWLVNRPIGEIKRVLDVGPGFGKWGFLCRLYLQHYKKIISKVNYPNFRERLNIDAIEIYPHYLQDLQAQIYNQVFQGDMREIINSVDPYDLIICGDVLEHINYGEGIKFLEAARRKAKYVLIIMPTKFFAGEANVGNEHEKHQHVWIENEWPDSPQRVVLHHTQIVLYENKKL